MNRLSRARRQAGWAAPVGALAVLAVLFVFTRPAAEGCRAGIELCMGTAVPALFPMMFATVLAGETGLTGSIGRLLAPIARRVFGLSQEAAGAVVMALVGGYPAGARSVVTLYERGAVTKGEAGRMVLFCFAAGPAFLIGAVGGIYGSAGVGAVLLVIQIISVVLMGLAVRLVPRRDAAASEAAPAAHRTSSGSPAISQCVMTALSDTVRVMLGICQYIILFSMLRQILDSSGLSDMAAGLLQRCGLPEAAARAVLPVVLEVTSGCVQAGRAGLPMTAFAVGFGGLAVHAQVLAIARRIGVKYRHFLVMRLMQGAVCAALAQLYLLLAPQQSIAASAAAGGTASLSTTPAGAVLLVVMSVMWIICQPEKWSKKIPTVP